VRGTSWHLRFAIAASTVLLASSGVEAATAPSGRLPMRAFTVLDGLPDDGITSLFRDSRGYLWVSTNSGVSRFDGSQFVNDLEGRGAVQQVVEGRDGAVWVATEEGLFRLDPSAPAGPGVFERVMPGLFGTVHVDAGGDVWAATRDRLYRFRGARSRFEIEQERIEAPFATVGIREIRKIASDAKGRLWLATFWGLVCRLPDGRQVHYEPVPEKADRAFDLALDAKGRVWIGSERLQVLVPPDDPPPFEPGARIALVRGLWARALASTPRPGKDGRVDVPNAPGEARIFGPEHGLVGQVHFGAISTDRKGRVWVGTSEGLTVLDDRRLVAFGPANGVPRNVQALLEDATGDLWFGTGEVGLRRWSGRGFVTYGRAEGLPSEWIASVFETRDGRIAAATRPKLEVSLFEEGAFRPTRVRLPDSVRKEGWGWGEIVAQDRSGDFWLGSEDGLARVPRRALDAGGPAASTRLATRAGLGSANVFRLFVDSRDALWISTFSETGRTPSALSRLRPADGTARAYTLADGIPATATAIAESPDGTIWFGLYSGGLARQEGGGFRVFGAAEGIPKALVSGLWFESAEILWAATEGGGLLRVAIRGDKIEIRSFTRADGLSNDVVTAVVGDGRGTIWLGTVRGVDRFEPATGRVESFSTADGLPVGYVQHLLLDRRGMLWVGTRGGLSRFEPGGGPAPRSSGTPLITGIEIDGAPVSVPALGTPDVAPVELSSGRRRLRIAYTAVTTGRAGASHFEHRLLGLEEAWSRPTDNHEVDIAGLPPGDYRFEVRVAGGPSSGTLSPATVRLHVPVPLWRRWWVLALGAGSTAAAAWAIHCARLRRLLDLERQRTRIAMDLHDEIGSGLGSIGLMADLAGSDDMDDRGRRETASEIGDVASELGTSLAELVGTLRPGGASLEALAKQMAERGRGLFPGEATLFSTSFPDAWPDRPLDLSVRRDLFLIGAEALHNAARHAGARSVRLSLEPEGSRWLLAVEDDGRGMPEAAGPVEGLGLLSMRRRAHRIGADLRIERPAGGGTRVSASFDPRRVPRGSR
jgi:ligand-binding sensor domain-containing protein/signal transduction histidine kinase